MNALRPGPRFWRRTLYDAEAMMSAGGPGAVSRAGPPALAPYPSHPRHPLPPVPRVLGDLWSSFHAFRAAVPDAGPPPRYRLDPAGVSALLHHTFGIAVQELGPAARWPYHRSVPSARCLFPTELRCWLPPTAELPAGVYSYDPGHHALVLVRRGDLLDEFGAAVSADLAGAACVLVLTSVFARTAARYGSYAYRLCTQEAGLVAGNALLVAGALGLQGHVHHHFHADDLDRLLGIPWPDESVMSIVALYAWPGTRRRRLRTHRAMSVGSAAAVRTAATPPAVVAPLDRIRCAELVEIDTASRAQIVAARLAVPRDPPTPGSAGPASAGSGAELAATLRRRWSGSPTFAPVRRPLPRAAIDRITRYALDAHGSDVVPHGAPPPVDCYVWLLAVDGVEPGVYRLSKGALRRHGPAGPLTAAVPTTNVNHRAATAVVYLVVNAAAGTDALGDRSFRVLHHEAGIVAQRICVTATAEALVARVHNGYPAGPVGRALGLPPGQEAVFQIVLGAGRAGEAYRMPIHRPESW